MLLRRTEKLPEGDDWLHELKFDGSPNDAILNHTVKGAAVYDPLSRKWNSALSPARP
jgi:hypothetical protein